MLLILVAICLIHQLAKSHPCPNRVTSKQLGKCKDRNPGVALDGRWNPPISYSIRWQCTTPGDRSRYCPAYQRGLFGSSNRKYVVAKDGTTCWYYKKCHESESSSDDNAQYADYDDIMNESEYDDYYEESIQEIDDMLDELKYWESMLRRIQKK